MEGENRTYNGKWRAENREGIKERQRKWREKNRERIRKAKRQRHAEMADAWRKAHPEKAKPRRRSLSGPRPP
jgi:hypothetical protein